MTKGLPLKKSKILQWRVYPINSKRSRTF